MSVQVNLDDPALLDASPPASPPRAAVARDRRHFSPAAFASSLGAEDMVLTDLIVRDRLDIEIFSLDTGRLPLETYDLIAAVKKHYGLTLRLYYPRHDLVEAYTRANGINAFYESVELRKGCCFVRKVEPLQRALAGRKAWITGMRGGSRRRPATGCRCAVSTPPTAMAAWRSSTRSPAWSEREVWAYLKLNEVPYNALHDSSTRASAAHRARGRSRPAKMFAPAAGGGKIHESKECGLHVKRA
jgi:phosphoadenosine phosphosulfate reductase